MEKVFSVFTKLTNSDRYRVTGANLVGVVTNQDGSKNLANASTYIKGYPNKSVASGADGKLILAVPFEVFEGLEEQQAELVLITTYAPSAALCKLDLVAASYSGEIKAYLGNGDGTFQAGVSLPSSSVNALSIALGHLNPLIDVSRL